MIDMQEIMSIQNKMNAMESDSLVYDNITSKVIEAYVGDLDRLIQDFNADAVDSDIDDRTLEKYLLELGNKLYFLSAKLEKIGVKEDVSKLLYKEVYNSSYLSNREKDSERKNKLTVAELTAIAESESKQEQIVNILYARIYSQIKMRMTAAYDLINSIRKIITRRMQDKSMSMSIPQGANLLGMTD